MPQFNQEDIEKIMNSFMEPEDTFKFSCTMCGDCCRKRSEPILLTGLDVFRIAQALEVKPTEVLEKYTRGYLGDTSHIPVFVLKERTGDGSCSLLRKGRCTVHVNKPVVCAIYPLGRVSISDGSGEIKYFNQEHACTKGLNGGEVQEWTLKAWLEEFNIHNLDSQSKAWNKIASGIATTTCQMDEKDISPLMTEIMLTALYMAYDTTMFYEDCVEANIHMITKIFKEVFHIDLTFQQQGE